MIECDLCERKFESKKGLASHRRWHDLPEYKKFQEKVRKIFTGKKLSKKTLEKISGQNHHAWKGDNAGYTAIHYWIRSNFPKPIKCKNCNQKKRLYLSNISGKYERNIDDYEWLCCKCHFKKDQFPRERNERGQFI